MAFSWRRRHWMHRARRNWRTDFTLWLRRWFRSSQWLKLWVLRRVHLAFSWNELRLLTRWLSICFSSVIWSVHRPELVGLAQPIRFLAQPIHLLVQLSPLMFWSCPYTFWPGPAQLVDFLARPGPAQSASFEDFTSAGFPLPFIEIRSCRPDS